MMLKEIRERVKRDAPLIKRGVYPFNTKQVFKDRGELLEMLDEAKTIIRYYYNQQTFDDIKAKQLLDKLD